MKLQIVSRTGVIFDGDVNEVVVPASDGEMGILPGHTPVLAVLLPGTVRFVTPDGAKHTFETAQGLITYEDEHVMVVVDAGEEAGAVKSA